MTFLREAKVLLADAGEADAEDRFVLRNLGVPFCNHSSGTVEVPLKDEF